MPYETYKLLHFLGILLVFAALGGVSLFAMNLGDRRGNRARGLVAATHGLGLLVVLLGGFGLLVHLGLGHNPLGWPGWVWVKLLVWLALGGLLALPYGRPHLARTLWWAYPLLGLVAAYAAIYKPF